MVKNPPANAGDIRDAGLIPELGRLGSLKEGVATHSSTLAWRIPWTEEPGLGVHEVAKEPNMTEGPSAHTVLELNSHFLFLLSFKRKDLPSSL